MSQTRIVEVRAGILKKNDELAHGLRAQFESAGVFVVNLVSSPGTGKTQFLERTLRALIDAGERTAALVGDLETDNDAQRLARSGAPARQINTHGRCHLEAEMIGDLLGEWELDALDYLFIENVGNLVCPASYDLGEAMRVALLSVTEGEDKPLKYPTMFNSADVAVITKMDLADACEFDRAAARAAIEEVRPGMTIVEVSAKRGTGMDEWLSLLRARRSAWRAGRRHPRMTSSTGSGAVATGGTPVGPADGVAARPPIGNAAGAQASVESLHLAARAVAQEPDARELARALAQQTCQSMHAEWAVVAMVVNDRVTLVECWRHDAGLAREAPAPAVIGVLEWVAQRRQLLLCHDPLASLAGGAVMMDELAARSVVAAPALHYQGHAVAVLLAANRRAPGIFNTLSIRVLETIAQQAVVGFDRAILLDQLGEWTRGMEAMLAFSASVNRQRDPSALVRDMVEHTARFLNADGGRAGLAERSAAAPDLAMVSAARWERGRWFEASRRWARHEGIPGYVLENEFPYLSADYPNDRLADDPLRKSVRFALCVPIKNSDDAVLGFFELHRSDGGEPFTWHDAAFLESLANTTAVAIENARLVDALAAKNAEVRALSAHHLTRLEEERQHIARELHDEAGQALVGVKLSLQAMAHAVPDTSPALRAPLDQLRSQVNEATARLRALARRLRPPTLDQLGLHAALSQLAQEAGERSGLVVTLDLASLPARLSPLLETALFRITQEALTNAINHADARHVEISLGVVDALLHLRIADDGRGFDPAAVTGGLGLLGVRERVGMLGGTCTVSSAVGGGTVLAVAVPSP